MKGAIVVLSAILRANPYTTRHAGPYWNFIRFKFKLWPTCSPRCCLHVWFFLSAIYSSPSIHLRPLKFKFQEVTSRTYIFSFCKYTCYKIILWVQVQVQHTCPQIFMHDEIGGFFSNTISTTTGVVRQEIALYLISIFLKSKVECGRRG